MDILDHSKAFDGSIGPQINLMEPSDQICTCVPPSVTNEFIARSALHHPA